MSDSNEDPKAPNTVPDGLIQHIDSMALPELKSVRSYVERRIEALRTPIEEVIEATAAGEVLKVEDHGAYAFVRKHPSNPEGPDVNTDQVSLYHVRREHRMDGTESLHWVYLGDVHNAEQIRCKSCGGMLAKESCLPSLWC